MNKKSANKQTTKQARHQLKPVYAAVLLACAVQTAQANPTGGSVVNGSASFATSGNTLTVTNTPGTIINWQSFSIGANQVTNFAQQSASSAVLNRVISNDPSNILGTLRSNGRVFLVNPNGIVFGAGAVVDVAGLVASSLNLSDADFLAGRNNFTQVPNAANVSNAGKITAQSSGQIYLIAPNVENTGVITAPNGEILLAAGASVELVNSNDPNLRVSITAPAGDATNIGQLVASAGNLGLFGAVVRNSGTVSADSATMQGGKIVFKASLSVDAGGVVSAHGAGGGDIKILADMQSGTVNITGKLDASAPVSGNGGMIETSAAHVQVANTARITTAAANGSSGTWSIDPTDFTIAATDPLDGSSYMSNTTLATSLGSGNVTIQTLATTSGAGNGDIFVNDAVSWASANSLTLKAIRDVNINAAISDSGTGNLLVRADLNGINTGTIIFGASGSVALSGGGRADLYYNPVSYTDAATKSDTSGNPYTTYMGTTPYTAWMLVNDVGQETGGTLGLQAMNTNLAGNYALGKDIDASAAGSWNAGAGFVPIGNSVTQFTGTFDGLGHTISNLTINLSASSLVGIYPGIGLFGYATGSVIQNVGLLGGSVSVSGLYTSSYEVGELVGNNSGIIINSYATGSVNGYYLTGGLVGNNSGTVSSSYASCVVFGGSNNGGLVGQNVGTISNSYASGSVSGTGSNVGGLVGYNNFGTISNSYATGNVSGKSDVGGLVGYNTGAISTSYVSGSSVTSTDTSGSGPVILGGLVGYSSGSISNSYVGDVSVIASITDGSGAVGGFVGNNVGTISNTYVNGGSVNGNGVWDIGGLVGINSVGGNVSNSYAATSVTGSIYSGSGLVGRNDGAVANSIWDTSLFTGSGIGGGTGTSTNVIGLTTADFFVNANFTSATAANGYVNPAWDFTPGTGTWFMIDGNTRPFLQSEYSTTITNSHQLQLMAMNLGASYTLGANIDMADTSSSSGMWSSAGFVQIGGNLNPAFTGQLDGLGHTISNLYIYRPAENYVGLFGYVSSGSISNVGLVNANVTGGPSYVGGLAGMSNGNISNSSVSGSVTGGADYVGGLAGYNGGAISNSSVSGSVTGRAGFYNVGGLVGINYGTIDSSSASGSVKGSYEVGGLVGYNGNTISNSHASGNVTGASNVGGLVGYSYGTISNSYVSSGSVSGSYNVGGVVGWNTGALTNSHYDINNVAIQGGTYVTLGGLYNDNVNNANGVGQYTDWLNGGLSLNIANYTAANGGSFGAPGGNSYTISTAQGMKDLLGFADNAAYTFSLSADITLTSGLYIPYLAANFNGANHTVSGLNLNQTFSDNLGLFGVIGPNNTVSNVALLNASVTGHSIVGALVGANDRGNVSNSSSTGGSVNAASNVGGLIGSNNRGSIDGSYVSGGSVTGTSSYVGGLVGNHQGSSTFYGGKVGVISNSYVSNGTVVSGVSDVGGLVGYSVKGSVTGSYVNGGSVTGSGSYIGGLVGHNNGTIDSGSAHGGIAVTGTYGVGGLAGYNDGGEGGGVITNSNFKDGTVHGGSDVGGLVGYMWGTPTGLGKAGDIISNSYVSNGTVLATGNYAGGLAGYNSRGKISGGSNVSGSSVTGNSSVGGLVGWNFGSIDGSYVSGGSVTGTSKVGGLVGYNAGSVTYWGATRGGAISNSYVDTGTVVNGGSQVGGLVGQNSFSIDSSHVGSVTVTGTGNDVGGLVGLNQGGNGGTGHWGNITFPGGPGGTGNAATISNSYVSGGTVSGRSNVGGLVGYNSVGVNGATGTGGYGGAGGLGGAATVSSSYVSGGSVTASVVESAANAGGLVGLNNGSISTSYASDGNVSGSSFWSTNFGGLVGQNTGSITDTYVNGGSVSGNASGAGTVGGLVGLNQGSISNSYASNGSLSGGLVGGVVGWNNGSVINTYWDTAIVGAGIGIGSGFYGGTNIGATPLTTGAMMTGASFVGFDLTNTWWISEGNTRPFLRMEWTTNIINAHQLQLMAMDLGANYTLANNLDLASALAAGGMWDAAKGFVPVGNGTNGFFGTFDGLNHTISNLFINRPTENYVGLFGQAYGIDLSASISNVNLANAHVTGQWYVGALVGWQGSKSQISNSSVSNSIVAGNTSVGGLVGYNNGSISGSYASGGSVTGSGAIAGGLVGWNNGYTSLGVLYGGSISNSYVSGGTVSAKSYDVGGLVGHNGGSIGGNSRVINTTVSGQYDVGGLAGYNDTTGVIGNSYASGSTVSDTSSWGAGGLVGRNFGAISNSYVSSGSVSGKSSVGGLVGYNYGTVSNSYVSSGAVTGSRYIGGLVGSGSGKVTNSHYNITGVSINSKANQVTPYGLFNDVANSGNGLGQFDDWLNNGMTLNIANYATLSGSNGSYTIGSVQGMKDLLGFADNANYSFTLTANITLSSGLYIPYLAASFDGANHTISGLNVNLPNDNLGLFGHILSGATVSNVGLANVSVTGAGDVGALAGVNDGAISGSHVTVGSVTGVSSVGGLVGLNQNSIDSSHADSVTVTGSGNDVGGLVGLNQGGNGGNGSYGTAGSPGAPGVNGSAATISNSYVTGGSVSGGSNVGGLVGYNNVGMNGNFGSGSYGGAPGLGGAATISNSYVSGGTISVTGFGKDVGGLVGNNSGTINTSYVTGSSVAAACTDCSGGAGGLVGYNGGTISVSFASNGSVSGAMYNGGLVGNNAGTISDTYASGVSVTGSATGAWTWIYVGGLVGNNTGAISTSYASNGTVTGGLVGGVVGANYGGFGSVSNTFWDTTAVGVGVSGIGYDPAAYGGATGLNAAGMMTMSNFVSAGWSIANTGGAGMTWRIYDGSTMPLLTNFLTPVTVTANNATATYTGLAFSGGGGVSYSVAGAGTSVFGTPVYGGSSQGAINAGTGYGITVVSGLYSGQLGYDISYAKTGNGTLTINPAALTITANNAGKTYDGLAYSGGNGVTYTGFVNGETSAVLGGAPTYSGTSQGAINAGNYAITPGGMISNGNYTITYVNGALTVTAAALNVTADALTKIYGNTDPVLTYSVTGLIGSDTLVGSLARATGENVSTYAITQGTLNNPNYTINFTGNNLTITARPIDISGVSATKVYGDADPTLAFNVGGSGLASWDTNATVFSGSLGRVAGENVAGGPYAINMGTLAANANYTTTFVPGASLTITPATLTVKANDASKVLSTADPLLTYMVSGLKLSDTGAAVLSGSLSRTTGEAVGSYQIMQGSLVANSNYTMTYVPGTFTILAPTVINEIVKITVQDTTSSDDDKKKYGYALLLADAGTSGENPDTQSLPICK